MQKLFKSALLITIFAFLGLLLSFITQVVVASLFGAGASMDAFLASNAIPQYIIMVIIGSLGLIFVPVFVDYTATGREEEAWQIASSVINLCLLTLGALTVLGMAMPGAILRLTAPGLPDLTHNVAVRVALITWPGLLATSIISLLTGIYQSKSRFGWPAAAAVIVAMLNLGLVVILTKVWGIIGLAIATTVGLFFQVSLLLPIALRRGCYRFIINWRHPAVLQVLSLLTPLVIANMIAKSTPLLDRFLASSMPEGSISHLGYAFRLLTIASTLIATGITTVVFTRMAVNAAKENLSELRNTISLSLRFMWLAVAPIIALGVALALPFVSAIFQRGKFEAADTDAVSALLKIYLLSLAGGCMGNITGRTFYVLKDTRTLAVIGSIESIAYVIYTVFLARFYGAVGVALGYVLFFNISLLWQIFVIRYKTGKVGGRTVFNSFIRIGVAALLGGLAAWCATILTANVWAQLICGVLTGFVAYVAALNVLGVNEFKVLWHMIASHFGLNKHIPANICI